MKNSIGKEIAIIGRQSKIYLERVLKPYNIKVGEHMFILNVENDKHMNQQQLCDQFAVDKAQATRAITSLVEKGLLKREKNPDDKREYLIALTDEGKIIKKKLLVEMKHWRDTLKGDMSEDELDRITEILTKFRLNAMLENDSFKNNSK